MYKIELPPVLKVFSKMSKEESSEVYNWYTTNINSRITVLENHVRYVTRQEWSADRSERSLNILPSIIRQTARYYEPEKYNYEANVFNDETYSLIFDISRYWGEVLIFNLFKAKWDLYLTDQGDIAYNQPVITSTKTTVVCAPIQIITIGFHKIITSYMDDEDFLKLYLIWKRKLDYVNGISLKS